MVWAVGHFLKDGGALSILYNHCNFHFLFYVSISIFVVYGWALCHFFFRCWRSLHPIQSLRPLFLFYVSSANLLFLIWALCHFLLNCGTLWIPCNQFKFEFFVYVSSADFSFLVVEHYVTFFWAVALFPLFTLTSTFTFCFMFPVRISCSWFEYYVTFF